MYFRHTIRYYCCLKRLCKEHHMCTETFVGVGQLWDVFSVKEHWKLRLTCESLEHILVQLKDIWSKLKRKGLIYTDFMVCSWRAFRFNSIIHIWFSFLNLKFPSVEHKIVLRTHFFDNFIFSQRKKLFAKHFMSFSAKSTILELVFKLLIWVFSEYFQ